MTVKILMPKIGFSMSEGKLAQWLVSDGTAVAEGDLLFALESDKSVQDIPSPGTGTLRISAAEGEVYEVGAVLGELVPS
ncbi:biotin/lipoyl-binding protein [Spongiibacter sp. KMU-166]|uniref:Biotin/lipoyl-binding protein n=1 Tax=Spongiibacter thalassae TaxID=2721624 RepID=A0ABX1GB32_9GAMM|nr:lipoyl domain-containing protein [Spongiibacter thalassae]NKI16370.1 biotin/lipoyl-binding protein [Spongiibacter thalassae]